MEGSVLGPNKGAPYKMIIRVCSNLLLFTKQFVDLV